MNEQIVYLLRKTNLTREDIGKLTPIQFSEILKEVYYQESVDNYRQQYSLACILSAIGNTIPRKRGAKGYKASDFLSGEKPERNTPSPDSIDELAKKRGIKMPSKELKER